MYPGTSMGRSDALHVLFDKEMNNFAENYYTFH